MSKIAEIIDTLENRIEKLLNRMKSLEEKNQELQQEITISANTIHNQTEAMELLKKDFETLRITNSLLGSEENKRETKLKINSLIREIDYCIAQLSD